MAVCTSWPGSRGDRRSLGFPLLEDRKRAPGIRKLTADSRAAAEGPGRQLESAVCRSARQALRHPWAERHPHLPLPRQTGYITKAGFSKGSRWAQAPPGSHARNATTADTATTAVMLSKPDRPPSRLVPKATDVREHHSGTNRECVTGIGPPQMKAPIAAETPNESV